jgi:N-methylhydantoinase B
MNTDIKWDGKVYPYIPQPELDIDPSLRLHDEVEEISPITHEVLRHALWQVNQEHGDTILRISGSPVCAFGHDFNPVLCDEKGDLIFFGPFVQYLAGSTSSAIKWTLENRSENPGIAPGDIFLANDPWIAAAHQSDVSLLAPVFVDGELFCWVSNVMHQWDLGGSVPGGFDPSAEEVYAEQPCIPPVKLVEAGVIRRDIEEQYLRSSRLPELVALDLRAGLSGCQIARERVLGIVTRYGAKTVKRSMRKLQDDSEAAFVNRLEKIPDGSWTAESTIEVKVPGDRGMYKNRITLTKKGDRLIFSNAGSAPQQGAICAAYPAWRGAVVSMLNTMMMFDQMFAIEGALRHCDFEIEPGTISTANRPAAVSGSPAHTLLNSINMSGMVLSKMLQSSEDPELREEACACTGTLAYPINTMSGLDAQGNPFYAFLPDGQAAAQPATSTHDGQDTGGYAWDLATIIMNVEDTEQYYPILYLWRKELRDSGGPGRFRGGNAGESCVIPHKTDQISWVTVTGKTALPGPGLAGGYPTSTNRSICIKGADVPGYLAATGKMPGELAELGGGRDYVPAKSEDRVTVPEDVWIYGWGSAGGYGDPLDRDPDAVRVDVAKGSVSPGWALEAYGVAIIGSGERVSVDSDATDRRRAEIRGERLAEAKPWEGPIDGSTVGPLPPDGRITEDIAIRDGRFVADGVDLGPANENYKLRALIREVPLEQVNPHVIDPAIYVDNEVRFRQIICPESGRLLDTELPVDGQPPVWDLRPAQTEEVA